MKTAGVYAHVADGNALATIDCSVPSNPMVTAYNSNIFMEAEGVYVIDTLAFINRGGAATFTIAVVKPPDTITRVGYRQCVMSTYPLPWGVGARDTVGFMAGGDLGLWIFNISDLTNPTLIDTFNTPGHLFDFSIKDTLLYAADRDSLLIFNIVDPANVHIVGTLPVPEGCYDVFVDSIYAYLACRSTIGTDGKMKIVDVSDPTNPQLLGEGLFNGDGHGIFVANDCVYVAAEDWWLEEANHGKKRADVEGGVRVFDPESPSNPVFLCGYDTPGNPRELSVQGDLIFVADYDSLQILRHVITGIDEFSTRDTVADLGLQISPNPFSNKTTFYYQLPVTDHATVEMYNVAGKSVKTIFSGTQKDQKYSVIWNGKDNSGHQLPAGVYFLRLETSYTSVTRKIVKLE